MTSTLRVALCQLNPRVADVSANAERLFDLLARCHRNHVDLVVLPELALLGYPPRDLVLRDDLRRAEGKILDDLEASMPSAMTLVLGAVRETQPSPPFRNAACVLSRGQARQWCDKRLLPNYDVFDERRYFEAGEPAAPVPACGLNVGVTVCEDAWNAGYTSAAEPPDHALTRRRPHVEHRYHVDPVEELAAQRPDLTLNLSASPFALGKPEERRRRLARAAARLGSPFLFVNQVGANDELVFDGATAVFDAHGQLCFEAPSFRECIVLCDFTKERNALQWRGAQLLGPVRFGWQPPTRSESHEDDHADQTPGPTDAAASRRDDVPATPAASDAAFLLDALTLGVHDYVRKSGFPRVIVGLSGGIDSAVTAAIAVRALGPGSLVGVSMPSPYTSLMSREDARELARNLGSAFVETAIDPLMLAYERTLHETFDALALPSDPPGDLTFENVQSRIRGALLMALSNRSGALVLTTGNKSEIAMGYCTLYGDTVGALAVLGDVSKTRVYALASEINRQAGYPQIPLRTLTREPSAELRLDQKDSDSLPPYDVLDPILEALVEEDLSPGEVAARGFDSASVSRVAQRLWQNEYKRRQLPPLLVVTKKAFGLGRRYPVVAASGAQGFA